MLSCLISEPFVCSLQWPALAATTPSSPLPSFSILSNLQMYPFSSPNSPTPFPQWTPTTKHPQEIPRIPHEDVVKVQENTNPDMELQGNQLWRKVWVKNKLISLNQFLKILWLVLLEVACLALPVLFTWRKGAFAPLFLTRFVMPFPLFTIFLFGLE